MGNVAVCSAPSRVGEIFLHPHIRFSAYLAI